MLTSACVGLVAWIASLRVIYVILGFFRQALRTRRTVTTKWGWAETFEAPEPFVMGIATYVVYFGRGEPEANAFVAPALLGAALATAGALLTIWVMVMIPSLSTGHYVLPGQQVVARGPYAWVRHPGYLAVFLIWFGLAFAFASLPILLVTLLYVVPAYWLYVRSEERMMLEEFGEPYRVYRERTGMFLPRLIRSRG
jgi:protein-S-isoprenylcysteine O-methyltransferase Ste14